MHEDGALELSASRSRGSRPIPGGVKGKIRGPKKGHPTTEVKENQAVRRWSDRYNGWTAEEEHLQEEGRSGRWVVGGQAEGGMDLNSIKAGEGRTGPQWSRPDPAVSGGGRRFTWRAMQWQPLPGGMAVVAAMPSTPQDKTLGRLADEYLHTKRLTEMKSVTDRPNEELGC
ncbi:hypothetical protein CPLU01_08669 [Colletotrichum plurivorum]|uniref:Uncharacterized protein n=1 Tax=Colletotrichum plurivorum TaxID=2175906 RepID=A0A8H6KBB7_9PEZI|nr:hypothetical protein CPLU01_08669 [Colletotrichum plurivorum]